jgi:hypothetical protein
VATVDPVIPGARRAAGTGWPEAAAVLGVVATLMLLAKHVRPLTDALGFWVHVGLLPPVVSAGAWARVVVWAAISVAVLAGWRRPAALGAWAAVGAEVVLLTTGERTDVGQPLAALWPLLLAVVAAALLSVPGAPAGRTLLGWGRTAVVGAAAAVAAAAPLVVPYLGTVASASEDFVLWSIDSRTLVDVAVVTYAVTAALVVAVLASLAPGLRRRAVALLAPIVALLAVLQLGFERAFSGAISSSPVVSRGQHAVLLICVPLVVSVLAVVLGREKGPRRSRTYVSDWRSNHSHNP